MINSVNFTKRLQKIIDFYDETASSFAAKVGVQRSSISHILSGRNKPSLDFVMKVLHSYPEVDLYWLLNGKGEFPKTSLELFETSTSQTSDVRDPIAEQPALSSNADPTAHKKAPFEKDSEIEKIVIFYKNGTFKSYKP
ncbi:MAG: helix-turn-helix transcriptional regulator [Bacteroidota bacterium]